MKHTKVKTTYEKIDADGNIKIHTLYCHHYHSKDTLIFFEEDVEAPTIGLKEYNSGKDKWSAVQKLWQPFRDKESEELLDGVEYYYESPLITKDDAVLIGSIKDESELKKVLQIMEVL